MSNNIIRVKKDRENPYVIINKKFLDDENLSWKAKGLLAYLLSKPDDWEIYISELQKHSTDGKDSTSSALNELIKNKYVERKKYREKGMFKSEYIVLECPVKQHSNRGGFSGAVKPERLNRSGLSAPENPQLLNNNKLNNNKLINTSLSEQNSDEQKYKNKNKYSEESKEINIAKYLLEKIKENNPNAKEPNLQTWADSIEKMIRLDKRNEDDIYKVIDFCQKDSFWQSNILSTKKLREKFDQLYMKMNKKSDNNEFRNTTYQQRQYTDEQLDKIQNQEVEVF